MSFLTRRIAGSTALAALAASLLLLFAAPASANVLGYPQGTIDGLRLIEGAQALAAGAQAQNIRAAGGGAAVELVPGAASGQLLTPPLKLDFEFNELIATWNASVPEGGGLRVWLQAGNRKPVTPWIPAGSWGRVPDEVTTRIMAFPGGKFDMDTVLLNKPAEWVQVRVDFYAGAAGSQPPSLRLLALSFTNSTGNKRLQKKFGAASQLSEGLNRLQTTQTANIPFRHQVIDNKKWIGRICSPASVNMALAHFGIRKETEAVARALYDPPSDAFGVWNRSIQGAAQFGVRGYVTRFRSWDQVRAAMAQGQVICASIRFKHGELRDPPRQYRKHGTEGHLVVIEGFAPHGIVLVNNSGTKDYGHRQPWWQDDLAKAWFDKGGVAYVFTGAAPKPM